MRELIPGTHTMSNEQEMREAFEVWYEDWRKEAPMIMSQDILASRAWKAATLAAEARIRELEADAKRWRTYENIRAMKDNPCDGHVMPKYAEDFIMANLMLQDVWDGSTKPEELRRIIDTAIGAALTEHKENQG